MLNEQDILREAANTLIRLRREVGAEDGEYRSPAWKILNHALFAVEKMAEVDYQYWRYTHYDTHE